MRSIETPEQTQSIPAASGQVSIVAEAADWFLRARDRRLTPVEEQALAQWFRQSPGHIAEFIRMYQLHGLLRDAKLEPFEPAPMLPLAPSEPRGQSRVRSIVTRVLDFLLTR
jgi:ferric-dicitrate binding protein FerR (iron transport regulator)